MKQLKLFSTQDKSYYGGSLIEGKRKELRPLCSRRPIHLVLKSQKEINLFKNKSFIEEKISHFSLRFGIKVYDLSVQKDHVHLNIRIHNREHYKKFIRSLTGVLARRFGAGIWKVRPFTRVAEWGRGFDHVKSYIEQNEMEIQGVISYQPRMKDRNERGENSIGS